MQLEHKLNICQLLEGKQDCTDVSRMAKQGVKDRNALVKIAQSE